MNLPKNYTWTIKFSTEAEKQFRKLDFSVQKRIRRYFIERVLTREDPRTLAEPLYGEFSGTYRYRVGDYRIVCRFEEDALIIAIIIIGHRKEIYETH